MQNAVVFDLKNWPGNHMHADPLPQTVQRLFELLQQKRIDYVLVGGVALLTYVEGRNTQDIGLIMAVSSLEGLLLLKLYALPSLYRQGSFARVGLYENDIVTLLYAYPVLTQGLQEELSRHLDPNDMVEVQKIIAEIQQRIERYRRGTGA